MIYSIATWISRVFHPFVVPIYALLIILVISPLGRVIPMTTQVAVWVSTIISAIVMPIATFATLKHFGVIKHKNLDNREDRLWPLLALGLSFSLSSIFIGGLQASEIFVRTYFVMAIQVFIFALISLYWKISMHAMAWGAISALFLMFGPIFRWAFILSLVIAAFVISSRLILGKHNGLQVLAGFLQGLIVTVILLSI